ncbi:MAG: hypothetical protein WDM81_02530 [Rhizomicrobium sp.]
MTVPPLRLMVPPAVKTPSALPPVAFATTPLALIVPPEPVRSALLTLVMVPPVTVIVAPFKAWAP